ncbi:MAG: CYTH domain-containing protein [Chloroflexi bacterium]|nr:CYTH domain-containing protein [Chloroflexota bacterium]MBV9602743.1 CYTH domain-containing protein [Chloroflexota bacterium]
MDTLERELKLVPDDEALLDTLASVERLGPFEARGRRRELQRNSFFDSTAGGLAAARVGFRRRVVAHESLATWSIKGDAQHVGGVASRSEIELQLEADTPPALALEALRAAAASRGAEALADAVSRALTTGQPSTHPFLETETDRRIVDLEEPTRGWQIELALDRMRVVGHNYREIEIEAELKQGADEALAAVRSAIESLGQVVHESKGSKLSRATAHLSHCKCP